MQPKNFYLKIIDVLVFAVIILILTIYIKSSTAEAWPRARDAMRHNDIVAVAKAIQYYEQSDSNSRKIPPFVNKNNSKEQEKNYLEMIRLIYPKYIDSVPKDPLGEKSPQGYGYLAMQEDVNQIAKDLKTAKNFRLGACSENTFKTHRLYDLSVTPIKGNIYFPQNAIIIL